jgi:hypothetical protein
MFSKQRWLSMMVAVMFAALAPASHAQQKAASTGVLREGAHMLSVQWISWDNLKQAGKAQVHKKEGDLYNIKGEQRSKDGKDFVTIDGTLQVTSPTELLFKGTIRTQVSDENQGNLCEKTGTYHFLTTQGRKYWRLQEMYNCDKNSVDYVDIFF